MRCALLQRPLCNPPGCATPSKPTIPPSFPGFQTNTCVACSVCTTDCLLVSCKGLVFCYSPFDSSFYAMHKCRWKPLCLSRLSRQFDCLLATELTLTDNSFSMAVAAYEWTTFDSQLSRLMRVGNTVRVVSLGSRVLQAGVHVHVQASDYV
jgi:hypothetical protein